MLNMLNWFEKGTFGSGANIYLTVIILCQCLASVQSGTHLYRSYDIHPQVMKESETRSIPGEKTLRVFSLNVWGLHWPFGSDGEERIMALRNALRFSNYDFVLLQEVWYRSQYDMLKGAMPYITQFEELNEGCSGRLVVPLGCSGLVILSRHPLEFSDFTPFDVRGSFFSFDGEVFVGKGIGRARARWDRFTVDLFTTHLVSYTNSPNVDNNIYRYMQAVQTANEIMSSNADIKIFGGDLNSLPYLGKMQPYRTLLSVMTDPMTEFFSEEFSLDPWFATFGNPKNTYSQNSVPERIDYLMYSASPRLRMKTSNFQMPLLMARNFEGQTVSVSDHEPLQVDFIVQSRENDYGNYMAPLRDMVDNRLHPYLPSPSGVRTAQVFQEGGRPMLPAALRNLSHTTFMGDSNLLHDDSEHFKA